MNLIFFIFHVFVPQFDSHKSYYLGRRDEIENAEREELDKLNTMYSNYIYIDQVKDEGRLHNYNR